MSVTEDEAKKLWCPSSGTAVSLPHGFCCASGCMAWRWGQEPNPDWKPDNYVSWPQRDMRHEPPMYIDDMTRGYCGLAGRP